MDNLLNNSTTSNSFSTTSNSFEPYGGVEAYNRYKRDAERYLEHLD